MSASKNKFQEKKHNHPISIVRDWQKQICISLILLKIASLCQKSNFHHFTTHSFCEYLHHLLFAANQISYTLLVFLRIVVCRKFLLSKNYILKKLLVKTFFSKMCSPVLTPSLFNTTWMLVKSARIRTLNIVE